MIRGRIRTQLPDQEKVKLSDIAIDNCGSLEELRNHCLSLKSTA
jgi:dephospho-CoA kinase